MKTNRIGGPPVLDPQRRRQEHCYELICTGRIRQAETDIGKLKNGEDPVVILLRLWLGLVKSGYNDDYSSITQYMEKHKNFPDDWLLPRVLASLLRTIDRVDLATDVIGNCYNRFDKNFHGEAYFNYLVRTSRFDTAQQIGMKLHPNMQNRIRAGVAYFVNVCRKSDLDVRTKLFTIAEAVVKKLLTADHQQQTVAAHIVKLLQRYKGEAPFAPRKDRFFVHPVTLKAERVTTLPTVQEGFQITFGEAPEPKTEHALPTLDEALATRDALFVLLREPNREWSVWERALENAHNLYKLGHTDGLFGFAALIKELLPTRNSDDVLPAATELFIMADHFGESLDSIIDRKDFVKSFIKRIGQKPHGIHNLIPAFNLLNEEEQVELLDYNLFLINHHYFAVIEHSKTYPGVQEHHPRYPPVVNINNLETAEERNEALAIIQEAFPVALHSYVFRKVLQHVLELQVIPLSDQSLVDIKERIMDLRYVLLSLFKTMPPGCALADTAVLSILRLLNELCWYYYYETGQDSAIEYIGTILLVHRLLLSVPSPALDLMYMNVLRFLGCADILGHVEQHLELKLLQVQSMGYVRNYYDSCGRFLQAIYAYEIMDEEYHSFLHELDDAVVNCYRFGFPELALSMVNQLTQHRNSVQSAVQFMRRRFYEILLRDHNDSQNLRRSILYTSFPAKLPFDFRDFQLQVLTLTVDNTAFALQSRSTTYALGVAEILIHRVLSEFILVIMESRKGEAAIEEVEKLISVFDSARDFFFHVAEKSSVFRPEAENWADPVIDPYIYLTKEFVRKAVKVLSSEKVSLADVVEGLPEIELVTAALRVGERAFTAVNETSDLGHRLKHLITAIKVVNYLSQIVQIIYEVVLKTLNLSQEQLNSKKNKPLTQYFKRFAYLHYNTLVFYYKQMLNFKHLVITSMNNPEFKTRNLAFDEFHRQRGTDLLSDVKALMPVLNDAIFTPFIKKNFPNFLATTVRS
uniref:DUF4132 domain-containing protein n=1 Tax=Panagrellus redivivus TaxID=6233 RepID=A0A7E4UX82_PANRE